MTPERSISPFGKRLKLARAHAKLTQKKLAQRSGVKLSTLSELETKAHSSGFTAQLAAVCGVNTHWLATGRGSMLHGMQPGVHDVASALAAAYEPTVEDTVAHLAHLLQNHSPTRQGTIAEVLAHFAREPTNIDLAEELVRQIELYSAHKGDKPLNQSTRAALKK